MNPSATPRQNVQQMQSCCSQMKILAAARSGLSQTPGITRQLVTPPRPGT